jgi:surfeit locus 1 family protein
VTSVGRRILVPALSTLAMLIVLVGLGTWQVYRLQWKTAILAQIAAAEVEPAVPLTATPASYTKISVTGRFRFDRTAEFGAEVRDTAAGPTMGFYQIVPLQRDGAPTVLVNRGWIPQKRTAPLNDPEGQMTVVGYIRSPEESHWFSATDDVAERHFYTRAPSKIAAALGVTDAAPFIVVALGPATTPGTAESFPAPAQNLPRPPNNHLSYAITWYGLAVALLVIFAIWIRKALRS